MMKVDINALIEPLKSAAGFTLGLTLSEFYNGLNFIEVEKWLRADGIPLHVAIQKSDKWLCVPTREICDGRLEGEIWFYSKGMVELHFNHLGILFNISLFKGYQGKLINYIYIGMPFSELKDLCNPIFNVDDEVYIVEDNDTFSGIGFCIDESVDISYLSGIFVSQIV
ncbi:MULTISPECIES: hypothetical protein [Acinetobacter]|uniref:hypothetical protein n=1 Tax=Acinetobacter TaxID=469 RepID=UPI0020C97C84|nr:hypothetical protein [Acinetobacter sp. Z1]UTO20944.1 hypothetical protein NGC85_07650 [Acinetobacter sp. Z1]